MSRPTTIRLADEEYRELEALAVRCGSTVTDLIREAVRTRYFRGDPAAGAKALLRFIEDHPADVEETIEALEARIDEAMGDAARR